MAGSQTAWGIDVGVSSLKAIKLRRDGDRVVVEEFDVLEHDKFLSEPDVDRDALIRSTLQKFLSKHSVKRDLVFIGVPGSSAFSRFVKLPPVETKKIPEIVRFEAIQQIPFPLEQVNWDYHTFQHPESPDVEVGIFAMKKELVAHVMSNFRALNMMIHGVQISPLAVYNAAAYDEMTEDKGTVIIDMGAEHTDIVIMDQGRVWLRSINTGGNHFTDALAKSFKQQFAKAEQLKKTAATSKYQKQIYQAMRPIFADLVAEIQRSLGAYNSSHRDSRLERIICMGNPFKLPNLQKYLQQELKMEVCRLENFKKATVEKAAAFSEDILSMATAFGLAVQALEKAAIETNLLPVEIARSMMWKKKQPWFILAAACVGVGAASMAVQWWKANSNFNNSPINRSLKDENTNAAAADKKLLDDWKTVTDTYEVSRKQVEDQFALVKARKVWPGIMADVFTSLPPVPAVTAAQAKPGPLVVITDITPEYSNTLAAAEPAKAGGAPPLPGTPAPAPAAAATPAATQAGEGEAAIPATDHGYIISISGYSRTGDYRTATDLLNAIVAKAPANKAAADTTRDYFFMEMPRKYQEGHQIKSTVAGMGGMGAVPGGGGGSGSTSDQHGDAPWGVRPSNASYWELFYEDITGISTTTRPSGVGPMAAPTGEDFNLPQPIDLVATRATKPPKPVWMAGDWAFTLRFKVFIKNDVH